MKTMISLLLLISPFVNILGQEVTSYPTMQITATIDGQLRHFYNDKFYGFKGEKDGYAKWYIVTDCVAGSQVSTALDLKKEEAKNVKVLEVIGHERYSYELVQHMISVLKSETKIGILKRDLETFEQVGNIVWLDDFGFNDLQRSVNMSLVKGNSGFYILSGRHYSGQKSYLAKYDFDMNILWNEPLEFLTEESVSLHGFEVDSDNDNFMLHLGVSADDNKKWSFSSRLNKEGIVEVIFTSDGDFTFISPQLESSIYASGSFSKYINESEELIGVFIVSKLLDIDSGKGEGLGYTYYRWNKEGEILVQKTEYFTLDEFKKTPYLVEYMSKTGLSDKDMQTKSGELVRLDLIRNLEVEFDESGSALVIMRGYNLRKGMNDSPVDPVWSSKLLFNISATGEKNWIHFFPYYMNTQPTFMVDKVRGNKLYLFTSEYSKNFENNEFKLNVAKYSDKSSDLVLAVRVIDMTSGDLERFKVVEELRLDGGKIIEGTDLYEYDKKNVNDILFAGGNDTNKRQRNYIRYTFN